MALQHAHNYDRSLWMLLCAILIAAWSNPVYAVEKKGENISSASAGSLPITFFQKSISRADGDRCPMYPSCSHYASQAIKRHGTIKGLILAFDRLLRCGHDEIRRSPKVRTASGIRIYDPVEANTRWWKRP